MSPHPRAQAHGVTFKRPETVDSYNDADVDDYSTQDDGGESTEPESAQGHTMYFRQVEERSDQYQVNAMDVEELRRSQRRYRAGRGRGHGDGSDDEDDDLGSSTPGADSSDKNIHSMLCVSMESVDQVGRRERFMQSNFESLSGGDDASLPSSMSNSISNAWRDGTGAGTSAHQRNAGTIGTARRLRDAEQNRRREELQRRIEETRMKLQNIGYRTLKGSQSINDLSSFPDSSPSSTGTLPRSSRGKTDKA